MNSFLLYYFSLSFVICLNNHKKTVNAKRSVTYQVILNIKGSIQLPGKNINKLIMTKSSLEQTYK